MSLFKIRFETICDPATTLTPARQASLLDDIIALNLLLSENESFRRNWRERSASFIADTDSLVLAYEGDELVGHCSRRVIEVEGTALTYIDTFTAHPRLHGSSLGYRIGLRMTWHILSRARGRSVMLGSRIEAPCLAARLRTMLGADNYYPSCTPEHAPPPKLAAAAEALAEQLWPDRKFSVETGVLAHAYGGRFLPTMTTRDAVVQAHFDRHVCAEQGDALVQVFTFRWSTCWKMFARQATLRLRRLLSASAYTPDADSTRALTSSSSSSATRAAASARSGKLT